MADQETVNEGEAVSFTLHRYGARAELFERPMTIRVQVTQDGEFIEGVPPVTVDLAANETSKAVTIQTNDDKVFEDDGAITLTILPPDRDLQTVVQHQYELAANFYTEESGYFNTATVNVTDDDELFFTVTGGSAAESYDGEVTVVITAAEPVSVTATVGWTTRPDPTGARPATPDVDYESDNGLVVFNPGDTTKEVSVIFISDDRSEPDETFLFALEERQGQTTPGILLGEPATITIRDDDLDYVIRARDGPYHGPVVEGENVVFHLERFHLDWEGNESRDEEPGRVVTDVTITAEGDVLAGAAPATVVFEAGEWTATVVVGTDDDDVIEPTGTVKLTLLNIDLSEPVISVDVRDNDNPLSIADAEAREDADPSEMVFTVSLGQPAAEEVTVDVATKDGTATSHGVVWISSMNGLADLGKDFEAKRETLTFAAGEQTKQFTVTLLDDLWDEPDPETFTVELSNPTGARLQDRTATGSIWDNETPMPIFFYAQWQRRVHEGADRDQVYFQVEAERTVNGRLAASELPITVNWEVTPGTASHGEDYAEASGTVVIQPGYLVGNFEVTILDDDLFERYDETFSVSLTGVTNGAPGDPDSAFTITIRDNETLSAEVSADTPSVLEGKDAAFTVTLRGGIPDSPVTVPFTVDETVVNSATDSDYTVPGGSDFPSLSGSQEPDGSLTIPAGETTGTFTIRTLEDDVSDPNEKLKVKLGPGITLHERQVSTPGFAEVTILENDTLSASIADSEATEGEPVQFTVTLTSAADTEVNVEWLLSSTPDQPNPDDTATVGVDYQSGDGTLTIPAGDTSATFTVATIEDDIAEGDEEFRVVLHEVTRDGEAVARSNLIAVGAIVDDDDPPTTVTLALSQSSAQEGAGPVQLTVTATLNGSKTLPGDTTVTVMFADDSATQGEDYTSAVTEVVITIPAGQLSQSGQLTLNVLEDLVAEADEIVRVTGSADRLTVGPGGIHHHRRRHGAYRRDAHRRARAGIRGSGRDGAARHRRADGRRPPRHGYGGRAVCRRGGPNHRRRYHHCRLRNGFHIHPDDLDDTRPQPGRDGAAALDAGR